MCFSIVSIGFVPVCACVSNLSGFASITSSFIIIRSAAIVENRWPMLTQLRRIIHKYGNLDRGKMFYSLISQIRDLCTNPMSTQIWYMDTRPSKVSIDSELLQSLLARIGLNRNQCLASLHQIVWKDEWYKYVRIVTTVILNDAIWFGHGIRNWVQWNNCVLARII